MASCGKFVAYYRVSTDRQGKTGLGLDAQRTAVATYLNGGDWQIVAEFTEVRAEGVQIVPSLIWRWPQRVCIVARSS